MARAPSARASLAEGQARGLDEPAAAGLGAGGGAELGRRAQLVPAGAANGRLDAGRVSGAEPALGDVGRRRFASRFSALIARPLIRGYLRMRSNRRTLFARHAPPRTIPPELVDAYTLGGAVPVIPWYFNDAVSRPMRWTPRSPWWRPQRVRDRAQRYYGRTDRLLYEALEKHAVVDRDVVIVGSEMPWYECICATYGARVTTIEYRPVDCRIPGLTVVTPAEFAQAPRRFDLVVSISSIEHDGLGRYGDPLRPDGDLAAMRSFRDLLRPGGLLILAVPVGRDALVWNAHRIYGPRRLPLLLEGWTTVDAFGFAAADFQRPVGNFDHQPVFVLRPDAEA